MTLIEQQWQAIITEGLEAEYGDAVPLSLLRDELAQRLDQERISQRFLAGPVNICTLMPMRSIPFKVVCLLGMNDGVYPRQLAPLGFDLMSQKPMRGDRSRRDDDRYLFLEALISAQQTLYISYIGRSIQDNSERFPSVLVQELMDYIGQSHYLPGDEELTSDESEARVKAHIARLHTRMPFDAQNYLPGEQQSYAREWLPAASQSGEAHSDFVQPLPYELPETLTLEKLQRFWAHPVRAFFQMRLQVNFRAEESEIPDTEPFILEGLTRYQLNQQLLNTLVEEEDAGLLFRRFRAAGDLRMALLARSSGIRSVRRCSRWRTGLSRVVSRGKVWKLICSAMACRSRGGAAGAGRRFVALAPIFNKRCAGNATLAGTPCLLCLWRKRRKSFVPA